MRTELEKPKNLRVSQPKANLTQHAKRSGQSSPEAARVELGWMDGCRSPSFCQLL